MSKHRSRGRKEERHHHHYHRNHVSEKHEDRYPVSDFYKSYHMQKELRKSERNSYSPERSPEYYRRHKHSNHKKFKSKSPKRSHRSRSRSKHRHHRYSRSPSPRIKTYILPTINMCKDNTAQLTSNVSAPDELKPVTVEGYVRLCKDISSTEIITEDTPLQLPYTSDNEEHESSSVVIKQQINPRPLGDVTFQQTKDEIATSFPVASGSQHQKVNDYVKRGKLHSETKVFDAKITEKPDIQKATRNKEQAVRMLQRDPTNYEAHEILEQAEKEIENWRKCGGKPGVFTGTTHVDVLKPRELETGSHRAFFSNNVFNNSTSVLNSKSIGQSLMERMGWRQGEGLGYMCNGPLEPINLKFNVTRKGLACDDEQMSSSAFNNFVGVPGQHPVTTLADLCRTMGWASPYYELVDESGPSHKRSFQYKVRINNVDYIPHTGSGTKKQAKADAAAGALFALGQT